MHDRAGRAAAAAARCTNRRRGSFTAFPFAGSKLMRNNRLEPSRSSSRPDNIIFAWWARDHLITVGMLVYSPAALARGRGLLADWLRSCSTDFVYGSAAMPFVDTTRLSSIEKRPGWRGRHFHSPGMTFGHWEFSRGSSIQEHAHPQEEVWEILAGELEVTIDGITQIVGPGMWLRQ